MQVNLAAMVTPMLDMSFQLLSFFVITYRPMPTEGQLSINMPKLDATESPQVDPNAAGREEGRILPLDPLDLEWRRGTSWPQGPDGTTPRT